ncbi:hypothetical protein B566_EDAN013085 [Ephemera danica]|nr:hypothetical protein B566_EDAN013085 [Ephemera danica]
MRAGQCSTEEEVLLLKASIWALAHCGSSPGGLQLLADASEPEAVTVADCLATLAEECPHYGIRATAFYACALLATTQPGVAQLEHSGWVCVKHARHDRFPVTEGDENLPPIPLEGELARDKEEIHLEIRESRRKRSTSQCSTQSAASWAAHFYIDTDEDTDEDVSERGYINTVMLREQTGISASPRRESGLGSLSPVLVMAPPLPMFKAPASHRRSQTLPHAKPAKGAKRHQRSLSESKGDIKIYSLNNNLSETPRRNSLNEEKKSIMVKQDSTRVRKKGVTTPVCVELLERRGDEVDSTKKFLSVPEPVEKSRSNSCTDSGVSSCDDYTAKPPIAERMPTLSPIPSSASLNTLRSAGQLARGQSARTRALSTQGKLFSNINKHWDRDNFLVCKNIVNEHFYSSLFFNSPQSIRRG